MDNLQTNTNNKTTNTNIYLNIFFAVLILGMAIFMYLKGNFGSISKNELEKNYLKKSDITFMDLSYSQKQAYVTRQQYKSEITALKNKKPEIVEKIVFKEKIVKEAAKIVEKIVYKEKIVKSAPQIVEVEKVIFKDKLVKTNPKIIERTIIKDKTIDKSKFEVFRCYGMNAFGYQLTNKCKSQLKKFVQKHKDSKYFEVIGVMNPSDFRTLMILEEKAQLLEKIDLDKQRILRLKELAKIGLDKLRVVETIWEIKLNLGEDTIVVPVSYNVNSSVLRGTVIRAYK